MINILWLDGGEWTESSDPNAARLARKRQVLFIRVSELLKLKPAPLWLNC